MRKLSGQLLTIAILSLSLLSCGSENKKLTDKKITVSKVNISGSGSTYLKVVDGEYPVTPIEGKIFIPIKLELVKKYSGEGTPKMEWLTLSPLDKNGLAIPDLGLGIHPATGGDWAKITDLLLGEVGKQATISFKWDYFSNEEKQARIINEIAGFELTRADITKSSTETGTTDNSSTNTLSEEGSENWDKLLDDYDKYTTDYIKFYKKAQAGDESAMAEYPAMLESSTKLQESLAAAQNDNKLSSKQLARMAKIQGRMVSLMSADQPIN